MFKHAIAYAHNLLEATVQPGETVIDSTCGNGNDTVALSNMVGVEGRVLAFDIQAQAIKNTKQRLETENITNVTLYQANHQDISDYIPENTHRKLAGAIFNLGYLPGSNKEIVTKPNSTIKAVDTIANYLKPNGVICIVVYHGHPGGEEEKLKLMNHLHSYDQKHYSVIQYGFINQKNKPPFVLAIEKK